LLMSVYFEEVKFYHYPLIKYYLLRGFNVYIFDFKMKTRKMEWLRELVDNKRILKVSHYVIGNDSLALDNIEKAYSFIAQKSKIINIMIKFYGDENITLAYKKMLAKELSNFYAIQLILRDKEKVISHNEKIVFIPHRYLETLRILTICNAFNYKLEKVFVPLWLRPIHAMNRCFVRLNSWKASSFNNFRLLVATSWKVLTSFRRKDTPQYKYAIPITIPEFQFKFTENRVFDFLLDHINIRKNNTVFLLLSNLDERTLSRLTRNDYNVIECRKKKLFKSPEFSLRENTEFTIGKIFIYTLQNFFLSFFEEEFIVLCSQSLVNTYLQWTLILSNLRFSHYIAFNDEEIDRRLKHGTTHIPVL